MSADPATFDYPTGSRTAKVECSVCGARGYAGYRWQEPHRRGHLPCRRGCGKQLPVLLNGAARAHAPWPHCTKTGAPAP